MPTVAGLPRRQHKKGPLARLRHKRRPPTLFERIKTAFVAAMSSDRAMAMRAQARNRTTRLAGRFRKPAKED